MFKVTQTWGESDIHTGGQAAQPREFDTLEQAGSFIVKQREKDKESDFDIVYKLFQSEWVEKKFVLDSIRIVEND